VNKARADLSAAQRQADEAQARGAKPSPLVQQFINEWRPKVGDKMALGNNADLRAALTARIEARNELLVAVLKARRLMDALDEKYQALADDPRVAEALSKLPRERVVASSKLSPARAKLAKIQPLVLGDEVPLLLRGQETIVSVLVNDVPCELAYVPQDFNMIPEALVKKLGITIDPAAPRAVIERTVEGNKRQVPSRQITIPSIQVGRHVLTKLPFLVTPPEGADMGAALGSHAFDGFRTETDYDNFVLKIRPENAPEPKAQKKAARGLSP
jgi:hypothetical protein